MVVYISPYIYQIYICIYIYIYIYISFVPRAEKAIDMSYIPICIDMY